MKKSHWLVSLYLLYFFGIFMPVRSYAQDPLLKAQLYTVAPPSPEAAAIEKYVNFPVSLSTGIPEISIPLYQYSGSSNKLNCAVSLSYHAGGIKVDEVASMVGLGWTLNYGGMISRSVKSLPDDSPNGYMNRGQVMPPPGTFGIGIPGFEDYKFKIDGTFDWEMDVFNFSFGGRSGKFYINKSTTGNRIVLEQSLPLNITFVQDLDSSILSFTITDDNGVKYIFSERESSASLTLTSAMEIVTSVPNYTSAWHLKEIQSPNGLDKIEYGYTTGLGYDYRTGITQTGAADTDKADEGLPSDPIPPIYKTTYQVASGAMKMPVFIKFPDSTRINFNYQTTDRLDLDKYKALASLDINGLYKYNFSYSYKHSTFGDALPNWLQDQYRLMLDQVQKTSVTQSMPPWKFYYHEGALPVRTTFAVDHWGGYNGATGNSQMIPTLSFSMLRLSDLQWYTYQLPGGNREPDVVSSLIGTLKKVEYPTGGTTEYEMENNDAYVDRLILTRTDNTLTDGITADSVELAVVDFTSAAGTSIYMKGKLFDPGYASNLPVMDNSYPLAMFEVALTDMSNTRIFYPLVEKSYTDFYTTGFEGEIPVAPGMYKLKLYYKNFDKALLQNTQAYMSVTYGYRTYQQVGAIQVGGLRAKKIKNTFANGSPDMIKEFSYKMPDGKSSGMLYVYPKYHYLVNDYVTIRSYTNYPLFSQAGSPVLYGRVEEKVNSGQNGTVISEFFTHSTIMPADADYPFILNEMAVWYYNRLLKETVKDASGKTVKLTNNHWYAIEESTVQPEQRGLVIGPTKPDKPLNTGFIAKAYYPLKGNMFLGNTKITEYNYPNGVTADSIVSLTNFLYTPLYFHLRSSETSASDGRNVTLEYQYPYDLAGTAGDPDGVYTAMKAQNLVGTPIAQISKKGTEQTEKITIPWKKWPDLGNRLLPEKANTQILNGADETRIRFSKYDNRSNILEQAKESDVSMAVIWDYNSQYPVAQITNAGAGDVAYTSFEADGSGNWTIGSTVRVTGSVTGSRSYGMANGNITRSGLNTAKRYKVSWWGKGGAVTVSSGTGTVTGRTVNGWTYYETVVTGAANITISGTGSIDELRLYPEAAQMVTTTYKPGIGVTHQCNERADVSIYEYDSFGRLIRVRDDENNILKQIDYQYQSVTP